MSADGTHHVVAIFTLVRVPGVIFVEKIVCGAMALVAAKQATVFMVALT